MGDETNPWRWLTGQAENGLLMLRPGIVVELAALADGVMERLLAVRGEVANVDSIPDFSNMSDGQLLAAKFRDKGAELGEILDRHVEILRDMAEALRSAGRAYASAEGESADEIDRIADLPTVAGEFAVPDGRDRIGVSTAAVDSAQEEYGVDDMYGDYDPEIGRNVVAGPEDIPPNEFNGAIPHRTPESISDGEYTEFFHSIQWSAAVDAASYWTWLADELYDKIPDFVNRLQRVGMDGDWRGDGASAAMEAATVYGNDVVLLTEQMRLVADDLDYTGRWMLETIAQMIPDVADYDDADAIREQRVEALKYIYHPAVDNANAALPALPIPGNPIAPMESANVTGDVTTAGGGYSPAAYSAGNFPPDGFLPGGGIPTSSVPSTASRIAQESEPPAGPDSAVPDMAANALDPAQAMNGLQQAVQAAETFGDTPPPSAGPAPLGAAVTGGPPPGHRPAGTGGQGAVRGPGAAGAGRGGAGSRIGLGSERPVTVFPRASLPAAGAVPDRVGAGQVAAAPGAPGAMAPGARGAGGPDEQRKRPKYLDSKEHLAEALGKGQRVVDPVVER
ncbi:hypothetical protein [Nocardia sp. BMG51109]|uniref:hypothetical protein n=1 Tax=Nocardia sp. BMG51109 TaxID=1056816 RepID=UPI000466AAC3|nr:hypothetical protein [Nocardia sp. BMG51109]